MAVATDRLAVIVEEVIQPKLDDHEARIRAQEALQAKLLAYAMVGSVLGGVITQLAFKFLSH